VEKFVAPPMEYRPNVWWHWLGSNFTTQGITKDLEAMAESGIGGPWIPEERGMKAIISSKTVMECKMQNAACKILLPQPELPEYTGYDSHYLPNYKPHKATLYWDITVMAIPEKENVTVDDIIEITQFMDSDGTLHWNAPAGKWTIYRYGYAPTMAHPHPLPDDIIGRAWEVDKMSREDNIYHWKQLLEPLKEHIGEHFGRTFRYIWVDSYESGYQNWTKDFREQFRRLKKLRCSAVDSPFPVPHRPKVGTQIQRMDKQ
jgi:hypothetical protein